MADKDKILAALAQLDPLDDDHWTADGAPKIEKVSILVGEAVKRQDIVNAAPDFNRDKSSVSEDEVVQIEEPLAGDDDVPSQEMSTAEFQTWILTAPKEDLEDIEAALKKQNDQVGVAIKNLQEQQKRISAAVTMTRDRIKYLFPNSADTYAIRDFINSQTAARLARVERRQTILKGIRPDELDYRAPIDSAMARKTKRGGQRPVRPVLK